MTKMLLLAAVAAISVSVHAEVFTVPELGLSLDAPAGFATVPADIVAVKWKQPQGFVIGNDRASTTITADLKKDAVRPDQVPAMEKALAGMLPRLFPGAQMVHDEVVTINGRRWGQIEMTTRGVDTGIHNIMLVTSMSGRMLALNFNSVDRDFATMEAELRKSIASLKVSKP